jgi:hypothetical protein
MDDRFDRRELLLHLGDMLQAVHCAASVGSPDATIRELATRQESLLDFEVVQMVAPTVTVAEFAVRVGSAFYPWPAALLETKLDHNAFLSTIENDLFAGNPDGWNAYVAHLRKRVAWFGKGLPKAGSGARKKSAVAVPDYAGPAEPSAGVERHTGQAATQVKTTWPYWFDFTVFIKPPVTRHERQPPVHLACISERR